MFTVPIDGESFVLGRVVRVLGGNVLIAVYAESLKSVREIDLDVLDRAAPIFLAVTMDLRLIDGQWSLVGEWSPEIELRLPRYKVQAGDGAFYEQHLDGSMGRSLTAAEAERLPNYSSYSPALVEMAVRAHFGHETWRPVFDEIRIEGSA
ncbi:Imm26 family immunity protein [Lentzea sp. NPDC003310]|uniref:Imm26 family immunity protein n=1 Tax=Lentzea sp. NPDC003310 TaxID=3154447 RepID=UPI0033B02D14